MFLIISIILNLFLHFNKVQCAVDFENPYQWSYLNYTWPSQQDYTAHLDTREYIPENNIISGIKIYKDTVYLAVPRYREGTPVALAKIPANSPRFNPLLEPYPNWELQKYGDCSAIQSPQSMEIDTKGIMWVIDGVRIDNISTSCPTKLILLDLKKDGKVVHVYNFPDDVSSSNGGFLNDIVIDESEDGDFAYITESSSEPGLIIYSRREDKAWKLRDDETMMYEERGENFTVNGDTVYQNFPINGIALSPKKSKNDEERYIYYSALTGFSLYRLPTSVAKDYNSYKNDDFRKRIEYIGDKQSQGDGMGADNEGNLYYSLIPTHGIGKWDTSLSFDQSEIFVRNETLMDWPDSIAFDNIDSIYFTTNKHIYKFLDPDVKLEFEPDSVEFNIIKIRTGTKSYLH